MCWNFIVDFEKHKAHHSNELLVFSLLSYQTTLKLKYVTFPQSSPSDKVDDQTLRRSAKAFSLLGMEQSNNRKCRGHSHTSPPSWPGGSSETANREVRTVRTYRLWTVYRVQVRKSSSPMIWEPPMPKATT